jgi:hypothetical protein
LFREPIDLTVSGLNEFTLVACLRLYDLHNNSFGGFRQVSTLFTKWRSNNDYSASYQFRDGPFNETNFSFSGNNVLNNLCVLSMAFRELDGTNVFIRTRVNGVTQTEDFYVNNNPPWRRMDAIRLFFGNDVDVIYSPLEIVGIALVPDALEVNDVSIIEDELARQGQVIF